MIGFSISNMANGGSMDEHMAGHVEAKMSKLANMKPSVLDSFTKLTSNIQKQRIFAGTSIITHILQSKTGAEVNILVHTYRCEIN